MFSYLCCQSACSFFSFVVETVPKLSKNFPFPYVSSKAVRHEEKQVGMKTKKLK